MLNATEPRNQSWGLWPTESSHSPGFLFISLDSFVLSVLVLHFYVCTPHVDLAPTQVRSAPTSDSLELELQMW